MKNEIRKGAIVGYISVLASTLIAILFTPILIKYLGTGDYGVYTLISSVMSYFGVLDLGLGTTAVRYIAKNYKNPEKVEEIVGFLLKVYLIISVITLILGGLLYFVSSSVFVKLTATELSKFKISLLIMTISLAISFPFNVCSSYIVANERFTFQKSMALVQSIAKPVIMFPLLLFGYKSVALILALAFINVSIYLINYFYAKIKLGFKFTIRKLSSNKELTKELFHYSFYILLAMIVDTVFNNTDQVILAACSGTLAVSIYNVSLQFRNTNTNLSVAISQLFLPKLTKMVSEKKSIKKISEIFLSVSRIQLYILVLICSGFLIFGQSFIKLWVGEQFLDAYYIVLIILIPNLVPLSQNVGISILQAMNKHKFRSVTFFLIAVLNIIISIPLAIKFSGIGAAIGSAVAIVIGQIIAMNIYYKRNIGLDIKSYWKNFIKIALPFAIISMALLFILKNIMNSWFKLIIFAMLYVLLYGVIVYVFLFNEYEKGLVNEYFSKIKGKMGFCSGKN